MFIFIVDSKKDFSSNKTSVLSGVIVKESNTTIKKIGTQARMEIESLLACRVNLQMFVKVKKDWRDSAFLLKNYGFVDESD